MAVRFDAATDRISYVPGNGNPPDDFTVCMYVRLAVNSGSDTSLLRRYTSGGSGRGQVGTAVGSGTALNAWPGDVPYNHSMTVGTFTFVAYTVAAGIGTTYAGDGSTGPLTTNSGSSGTVSGANQITLAGLSVGNGGQPFNGAMTYVRVWSAVLSEAELQLERASATPVRTADLWADWPLEVHTDLTDHSGNGRDLAAGTTSTTTEAGPDLANEVTGTALAVLGGLTSTATGTRVVTAVASAPLAGLTATATGRRATFGTATVNLTAVSTATGTRTTAGSASASVALTATATGTGTVPNTALAQLGGLTATAIGTRTVRGSALAALGALRVVAVVPNPLPEERIRASGREPYRSASGREPREVA